MTPTERMGRASARAKKKGVTCIPIVFASQVLYLTGRLRMIEAGHSPKLIALAKKATAMVWGISTDRLNANLTKNVAFGNLSIPRSAREHVLRGMAVGYGGVLRSNDSLEVVARATNWQLLAKELVKGTAELICLHGLNTLREDIYKRVVYCADRIEFEPWMLQTGGELWRLLLAATLAMLLIETVMANRGWRGTAGTGLAAVRPPAARRYGSSSTGP